MTMKMSGLALAIALILSAPARADNFAIRGDRGDFVDRRVIELYINDRPYTGNAYLYGPTPLHRGRALATGYHTLYIAEVVPGMQYSLGLSHHTKNAAMKFRVTLFDRWPYLIKARKVELPGGPTVRTKRDRVEYRWEVGISPRSTSTVLYILVETDHPDKNIAPPRHTVFVVTPPVKPSSTMGRGITFLQGPVKFQLVGEQDHLSYVVERPKEAFSLRDFPIPPLPGDIIKNARFTDGLNYWEPHKNYETSISGGDFFSLNEEGLKIWSNSETKRAGLMQVIDEDVTGVGSLILRADVRVDRQTLSGTGSTGNDAPIAIAVCYEDVTGGEHCGEGAFWKGFYILAPREQGLDAAQGRKVVKGLWYRFTADLMELEPRPGVIKYISLEGSGWPKREGWVREVHLIKRNIKRNKQ